MESLTRPGTLRPLPKIRYPPDPSHPDHDIPPWGICQIDEIPCLRVSLFCARPPRPITHDVKSSPLPARVIRRCDLSEPGWYGNFLTDPPLVRSRYPPQGICHHHEEPCQGDLSFLRQVPLPVSLPCPSPCSELIFPVHTLFSWQISLPITGIRTGVHFHPP